MKDSDLVRHFGTTSERHVLALEMIADQLALIHEDLAAIIPLFAVTRVSRRQETDTGDEINRFDSWENEGGKLPS